MTNTDRVVAMLKEQNDYFHALDVIATVTGLSIMQANEAVQALKGMDAVLVKRERIRGKRGATREIYCYRDVLS